MEIPPGPFVIAFGFFIKMLNAELVEKRVIVAVAVDKTVVNAAPKVHFGEFYAVFSVFFSKIENVVTCFGNFGDGFAGVAEDPFYLIFEIGSVASSEVESAGKRCASSEFFGAGERGFDSAVAAHRKTRNEIILAFVGHSSEIRAANGRELFSYKSEIVRAVGCVGIPASADRGHNDGDTVLCGVTLYRRTSRPDRVVVGKAVEEVERFVGGGGVHVHTDERFCFFGKNDVDGNRKLQRVGMISHFKKSHNKNPFFWALR